ncbi:SRPBCC domain-containing protein [Pullulanibacillus sp. KACC 23026]|uniref:SRPBCC domain-containing protein n=1 Tax=Pullulanibacillus sp. KACC 23026 TaxID=3028315 RepID=UPI0023B0EC02|nr:SRPBCC domain-containing protein [Pullulanibacillus sp. KACC 23026]WEG10891.1 SRPBCC domain-containing protein [Pullulanibacillus sp. KACC 23026]
MNNLTKIKIEKPAKEIFEAFVDPEKIGGFWFSSCSERWEQGKTVTLRYEEYNAQGDIKIAELEANKKIVFHWGTNGEGNKVSIFFTELEDHSTSVVIEEEGFSVNHEDQILYLLDNKGGWVYTLTCLKAYLEFAVTTLRASLIKK